MDALFFIKLALQGGRKPSIRGVRGVSIYVESPLRLDSIGKNAGGPLFMLFSSS